MLSIFGMLMMTFNGRWGTELIGVIGGTEVSNPFLQLRWFLKEFQFNQTLVAIVDFSFILVFGVCRLLIGGYILYYYVGYPKSDFLGKLGAVTMYALSVVFYFYILRYAIRKYGRSFLRSNKQALNGAISNGTSNVHVKSNGHDNGHQNGNHLKSN